MRDGLACKSLAPGDLQACLLWVVSSECFELCFAFRKAAIVFLDSECHCCTCPGTVVIVPHGCTDLDTLLVSSKCFSLPPLHLVLFAFVCLFSRKRSPKTSQARSKYQSGFSAPVRLTDLNTFTKGSLGARVEVVGPTGDVPQEFCSMGTHTSPLSTQKCRLCTTEGIPPSSTPGLCWVHAAQCLCACGVSGCGFGGAPN